MLLRGGINESHTHRERWRFALTALDGGLLDVPHQPDELLVLRQSERKFLDERGKDDLCVRENMEVNNRWESWLNGVLRFCSSSNLAARWESTPKALLSANR